MSIFTIYALLSRFTFCRDLRTFSAIFFGQNSHPRHITRFLHVWCKGKLPLCKRIPPIIFHCARKIHYLYSTVEEESTTVQDESATVKGGYHHLCSIVQELSATYVPLCKWNLSLCKRNPPQCKGKLPLCKRIPTIIFHCARGIRYL